MLQLTRRQALVGASALAASCAHQPQALAREGRVAVPGGEIVWRRFGDGAKTPLLAVHGGPGAPSDYLEPLAALGDERSVYLWDQLGCGRSDRPTDPSLWNIPRFVEEMQAVRAALGLRRVHILGQSWGTCLSVDYLLSKGERGVSSLVLAGPVLSASRYVADVRPMLRELSPQQQAAIAEAERTGRFDTPEYMGATEAFYALHLARHPNAQTGVLWRRTFEGFGQDSYVAMNGPSEFSILGSLRSYEREADLARLHVPVLYVSGEYDTCTPGAARQYASHTPNAEVAVIPNSGHATTIDEPQAFNAVVRRFIEAHDS
jgi:proline iminopeptidase